MVDQDLILPKEAPRDIIKDGWTAARQLQAIVSKRKDKVVISGKQYLLFEDWQTLGRFFRITAKIALTQEIRDEGKVIGFFARAVALRDSEEISAADAECCFDEDNWKGKPRFQLRSMAQTRAAAKTLRNCLSWIAVLAGYPTATAEEVAPKRTNDYKEDMFD